MTFPGAILGTAGLLLLVYALVRAPEQGWASARTIGELATAAAVLAVFALVELRRRGPLFPFSIFRIRGLAAADVTQMIAFAGFVSVFFFLTLYMQNVLRYSPIRGGAAYLPVTAGIVLAAGISARLFARIGTRPVIVAGSVIAAAGIWYLSRVPVHGSYVTNLLPGLVIMAIGLGAVLVSVTTAANAGVPPDQAGLAAGLLSSSQQLGTALGLAIFSAIATARTSTLLAAHATRAAALTGGLQRACWPARSSCSPPPSSRCAPPTPAASRPRSPPTSTPVTTGSPHRNWLTKAASAQVRDQLADHATRPAPGRTESSSARTSSPGTRPDPRQPAVNPPRRQP